MWSGQANVSYAFILRLDLLQRKKIRRPVQGFPMGAYCLPGKARVVFNDAMASRAG